MPRGGYQFDSRLISFPTVFLSICSSPAALPPQMESDGNTHKRALYLHAALPRNSLQCQPLASLSPFHSLSKVSTTPPQRQLRASSPVWCLQAACVHSSDLLGRAEGFSGSSCTHQLGVVWRPITISTWSLSSQGAAHRRSQARRGIGNTACPACITTTAHRALRSPPDLDELSKWYIRGDFRLLLVS